MLVLLLMLAQEPEALVAKGLALTAAERPCPRDTESTDVTVCGRRRADRYRVPLVARAEPEPTLLNNAAAERTALLHRTTPVQDLSPFLVGGGMAGVSVGTRFGPGSDSGKPTVTGVRPLAP